MSNGIIKGRHIWLQSILTLDTKKDKSLRPISVDNIFVRICGKCLNHDISADIVHLFENVQLGVGINGGVEIAAQIAGASVNSVLDDPELRNVFVKLDIKNAYGIGSRIEVAKAILLYAPSLYKHFLWKYAFPSPLYLSGGIRVGDQTINWNATG